MLKPFVPPTHLESNQKSPSFLKALRTTAHNFMQRAIHRFEGTPKYTPFLALGAIATGYGVLKGQGDAELFGAQLQALSTDIVQGKPVGSEVQLGESLTGMMYGLGSFAVGVSTLIGATAHKLRRTQPTEDTITAGTFVEETAITTTTSEDASYTPRARHLGRTGSSSYYQATPPLAVVRPISTAPVLQPTRTTLDSLLGRVA